jgi:Asp-tRNA(Asn)/Glu-tRNA(Gln) amidotransferase A subunit family amidase
MKVNVALLIILIFGTIGCQNQKEKEPLELNELTIAEIHEAYKKEKFTAEQLTIAYLNRIAKFDGKINSITIINPEAISKAKQLDIEYQQTRVLRPLHGIPIIVKDNINTVGMPTTAGSLALKSYVPDQDAPIIKKLVDAGAIILAKSNMAEWAFSPMHTESSTNGTTHNPYNLDYVPAGSSGGTASSIASNFGTIGLGTDTGNSIRGPSSHCSLVGFRTTLGLVSRSGIVPLFMRNDVVGPMCRTVEDATKIMEVMAGYDATDPLTKYSEGKTQKNYQQFLDKNGLKGARIGVLRELSEDNIDPEIKVLFEQSILDLQSLGAKIIDPLDIPNFSSLRKEQWCGTFRKDVEAFLATHVKSDTLNTLEDIIKIGSNSEFASSRLDAYASQEGRWNNAESECGDAYNDNKRIVFRTAIEKVMDSLNIDALIYPSWNNKPARITNFEDEYKGDNNQVISPHTGQPAFTVPMGYTSGNLPVGIQFLGRMYSEPTLIKLAYAYEQGTNHRKPPILE